MASGHLGTCRAGGTYPFGAVVVEHGEAGGRVGVHGRAGRRALDGARKTRSRCRDGEEPTMPMPALAGGRQGAAELRPLVETVLAALAEGARARGGAVAGGGPEAVAGKVAAVLAEVLPRAGSGEREALYTLVRLMAEGAADPAEPNCAAHLHCPPLAVATAADLAASALNPSLDSWDQAPAASELEALVTKALAHEAHMADALVTTG